jgi:hypothetical protein
MDYVEGEDLASMLERVQQPLAEESVLNWADQVLDALTYLHGQRPQPIIHRDIKPANVRLSLHGRVRLVDFGLVKLFDASHPETKVELRGLGTPAYAPLEQFASSDEHTDARSDIYALGATMYHLLTNLYPPDVHQRILHPEVLLPPRLFNPHLSENTEQVVLKAMAIHPDHRYQSVEEMRQALAGQAAVAATKRSTASPWWFASVGLAMVLFILVAAAWLLFGIVGGPQTPTVEPVGMIEEQPAGTPVEAVLPTPANALPTDTPTLVVQTIAPLGNAPAARNPIAETETPTPEESTATPTPVPLPESARPQGIPVSSLTGAIAYPVFNGTDYDIYLGQADGSGTQFFRAHASQPAFSPDGSRITFHSWQLDARGLMTMDVSGANLWQTTNFFEDQLPTWSPDGSELILLTRRSGDRKSQLIKMGSFEERVDGVIIGEGEYPTIGLSGQLAFKGWGNTAGGMRLASLNFENVQPVTDSDADTAPALSPDGRNIAFMSQRDENWEIYLVNADGSGLQRLTDDPADDGLPTWSPDGKVIAFVSNRGGAWAVWAMTPTGQDQRQLFAIEGSPDGMVGGDIYASRGWTEERISWKK